MSDLVRLEVRDHVAEVLLDRPDKLNAINHDMWAAIGETGESLASDRELRAVILSGAGRGFCAGLDMASFADMQRRDDRLEGEGDRGGSITGGLKSLAGRSENFFQRAAIVWKRIPVPVVCALHGVAYGAGAQVALGADIRIAAPDLRLSILEIKWGLIPDVGITQTLRDLVPLDVAKELTFTGRILDADAAHALGLVTRIAEDPLAEARALASEIAGKNPDAIRAGKRLLDESWHAGEREGLELEARLQAKLLGSPNQVEAIRANFEKRTPEFAPASLERG